MAKYFLDLTEFKASGVYTVEYDNSESIRLNTQTVRLVIGFSKKGPINAPVYCPDKASALRVYGDIDTFLERRGSFFHRSLLTCLEQGPVFGLNLMALNNDPDFGDKTPYRSFSVASTEANGKKVWKLYASYYNKERFWKPDQDYLLGNVNSPGSINEGKIFNLVNLSQTPVSVLIKKADVSGFAVTARSWYGVGNVPQFIDEYDFIEDYFIQVVIVEGNWTNYTQLSIDPIFSEYFDSRGLIKSKERDFYGLNEVSVIGQWTGSIIPDLTDGNGVTHSVDTIINNSVATTGLFVAIDRDVLENYDASANEQDDDQLSAVDMVGHNFADPTRENPDIINFLSYRTAIKENLVFNLNDDFTEWTYDYNSVAYPVTSDSRHLGLAYGYLDNVIVIPKPIDVEDDNDQLVDYTTMKNLLEPGVSLVQMNGTAVNDYGDTENRWATVGQIWEEENAIDGLTYLKIAYKHSIKENELALQGLDISSLMGNEVALLDPTDDADYLSKMTALGIDTTSMHIVINEPTVDADEIAKFNLAVDDVDNTTYLNIPKVGQDVLIEDVSNKISYYFKVSEEVVVYPDSLSTADKAAIEAGGYDGYGSWDDIPKQIFIPIVTRDDIGDALELIDQNLTNYQLFMSNSDYVNSFELYTNLPTFVYEPDKLVFLDAEAAADYMDGTTVVSAGEDDPNLYIAYKGHKLYEYYEAGALLPGDKFYTGTLATDYFYVNYDKAVDSEGIPILKIQMFDTYTDEKFGYDPTFEYTNGYDFSPLDNRLKTETDSEYNLRLTGSAVGTPVITDVTELYMYVSADDLYDEMQIVNNSWNAYKTKFAVRQEYSTGITVGDYIVSKTTDDDANDHYKLTKVISKKKVYNTELPGYVQEYEVNQPIYIIDRSALGKYITRYKPLDDFIQNYQMFHLDGFTLTDYHLPGGAYKKAQLEKILGMLNPANSNLMEVLSDKHLISFRYIVDTFDGGLAPMTGPKTWLTKLAKERQKCLAIMNAPSMKEFADSNNPRFTSEPTRVDPKPILNTRFIPDGGNQDLGPSFSFTLPDETYGSKFCGYFAPFLKLYENGKQISVPPAADVSNKFIQKFKTGNPFGIVAGPKRGVLSNRKLVGLEYDFLLKDREYLEPFGINPIIQRKGVGYMIFANSMAFQNTRSAFNSIHVRDLLITIEDRVEQVLSNYLFEFNDDTTRLEIKTIVEVYLDTVRANGGIYNYTVIMNEENNTNEVIDANTGIIDIAIEPAKGLQKFINRVTVMKTGGISSGGFSVAGVQV